MRFDRATPRIFAAAASLGLAFAPVASRAAPAPLHVGYCGSQPLPAPPVDGRHPSRTPDCPSPCHAACPRKHTETEREFHTE